MATKVEELRDELLAWYENPDDKYEVESRAYALIAAARAEGAEAERERIVRGSERFPKGSSVEASEYIDVEYGPRVDDTIALAEIFVTPASLLAPAPKEDDHGNA